MITGTAALLVEKDAEIERLRAENAALREAIKGNANVCSVCGIDKRLEGCKGNPLLCPNPPR